jgi:hypothetical protein
MCVDPPQEVLEYCIMLLTLGREAPLDLLEEGSLGFDFAIHVFDAKVCGLAFLLTSDLAVHEVLELVLE